VANEVYVVSVLFWDTLSLRVSSRKHMLAPLLIVKSHKLDPLLEVLILAFDDSLLPFLVMTQVIIGIESVVIVMAGLFVSLRDLVGFQSCGCEKASLERTLDEG
jgi:hypothetical protein